MTAARRKPAKKQTRAFPTLKPAKLPPAMKVCFDGHQHISYEGLMCPLCHEVEAFATLQQENIRLRNQLDVASARYTESFLPTMRSFGEVIRGLNKAVATGRLEAQSAEARTIEALGDFVIHMGAVDDAIATMLGEEGLGKLALMQLTEKGYVKAALVSLDGRVLRIRESKPVGVAQFDSQLCLWKKSTGSVTSRCRLPFGHEGPCDFGNSEVNAAIDAVTR